MSVVSSFIVQIYYRLCGEKATLYYCEVSIEKTNVFMYDDISLILVVGFRC